MSNCQICQAELPDWRSNHTDKCVECGVPRCRGCGANVQSKQHPHTQDGGYCTHCSPGPAY